MCQRFGGRAVITAVIRGLPDLRAELRGIVPKLRVRALRNSLAAGARVVQREARARTPVLKMSTLAGISAVRRGVRKPGTVRRAISVRTSKIARRSGDVGVFVNVRPLRRGGGSRNPDDPFYWRWLNFGWQPAGRGNAKGGAEFLEAGAKRLPQALEVFKRSIGPAIAKLNRKGAPAP